LDCRSIKRIQTTLKGGRKIVSNKNGSFILKSNTVLSVQAISNKGQNAKEIDHKCRKRGDIIPVLPPRPVQITVPQELKNLFFYLLIVRVNIFWILHLKNQSPQLTGQRSV
jgi:hypothetical protein